MAVNAEPCIRVFDIETTNTAGLDLTKVGAARYAESTIIDCVAWQTLKLRKDGKLEVLDRESYSGSDSVKWLNCMLALHKKGDFVVAHNMMFELLNVCQPHCPVSMVPTDSLSCTMAMARYLNLPAKLDDLAYWLLGKRKDDAGKRVLQNRMKDNASGQGSLVSGDEMKALVKYCEIDVDLTARCLAKMLPAIGGFKGKFQQEFTSHVRVSMAGLPLDMDLCRNAAEAADRLQAMWDAKCRSASGHGATEKGKIKNWLAKEFGVTGIESKSEAALLKAGRDAGTPEAIEATELCVAASSTSIRKWQTMVSHASYGRLRDQLVYCGTAPGRWASFGVQLHNFPNPKLAVNPDMVKRADLVDADSVKQLAFHAKDSRSCIQVAQTMKLALRRAIAAPPGRVLVSADYAQIELRVLLWLCGQMEDLKSLHEGADLYRQLAQEIFGRKDIEPWQRSVGKQAVLAMGYGMGANLFAKRLTELGVNDPELVAKKAKTAYHQKWPQVRELWELCGEAWQDGEGQGKGWSMTARHLDGRPAYVFKLPSGRPMVMWEPQTGDEPTAVCDGRERLYRSYRVAQNLCQASARDILAEAIIRLQSAADSCKAASDTLHGAKVVGHVHDSIIVECEQRHEGCADEVVRIMEQPVSWMKGLPLKVEADKAVRWW